MYCSILLQNIVIYNKSNILPQSVVFPMNYSTINCSILQQNIVVNYKKTMFYYKM